MARLATALLAGWIVVSCAAPQPDPFDTDLVARVRTNVGTFRIALAHERTPMTVANFVGLAEGTVRNQALPVGTRFYDGSPFHRVVAGHVIQGGQAAGGAGAGPGYRIPNEIDPALGHGRAGMVGMAHSGPHTGGSQWYVTLGDRSYLDGNYTVFGKVIEGMDVVMKVRQGDVIEHVEIERRGALEGYAVDDRLLAELIDAQRQRVARAKDERDNATERWIAQRWPDSERHADGSRSKVLARGSGEPAADDEGVVLRFTGESPFDLRFASSESGTPDFGAVGMPFFYSTESNALPATFSLRTRGMRPGERRVIVLPPHLAYGDRGFYGPADAGTTRFVIDPDTTLAFEVERVDTR